MESSAVADDKTGGLAASTTRTSTGAFLDESQDEVVAAIEKRVAQVTMLPKRERRPGR
jgi:hypothetical protein